jgi:hypothetical protein
VGAERRITSHPAAGGAGDPNQRRERWRPGISAGRHRIHAGYFTAPAVMPATRKRCSSRKPTTMGTLTVSDAAMIWFQ